MGKQKNIIELNGHRYDAHSGHYLPHEPPIKHPKKRIRGRVVNGQVIDGFVRPSAHKKHSHSHQHAPAVHSHVIHKKTNRSKTLMRSAVKSPVKTHPKIANNKNNVDVYHLAANKLQQKYEGGTKTIRSKRASQIPKSNLVRRFSEPRPSVKKIVAPLAVRPAPSHNAAFHSLSTPIKDMVKKSEPTKPLSIFDEALQSATSHELLNPNSEKVSLTRKASKRLKVSPKTLNIALGLFISIFAGSVLAYQSVPELSLQVAAMRAGIKAQMPGYKPSEFSVQGPVSYNGGEVQIKYQSNSDYRNFQVSQKTIPHGDATLLADFVASKELVQTFQDKGRTIFVYENNSAVWVSGNVWYQIEGDSGLSSEELRRLISSF